MVRTNTGGNSKNAGNGNSKRGLHRKKIKTNRVMLVTMALNSTTIVLAAVTKTISMQ